MVIDGGEDATADVARSFAHDDRVQVIALTGRGVSAARNAGLQRCRAPYVLFLDGDDMLTPDALEHLVRCLDAPEHPVAAVGAHVKIDEAGRVLPGEDQHGRAAFPAGDVLRVLLARNLIVNGGTICLRTDTARAVGGYDASLCFGEDWEFWCRLAGEGPFASIGDRVVLLYRQRGASAMTRQRGTTLTLNTAAIDRIFALPTVHARFSDGELASLRRRAVIDMHWATARAALYRGERQRFAIYVILGLLRYPDSLLHGYLLRFAGRQLTARLRRQRTA